MKTLIHHSRYRAFEPYDRMVSAFHFYSGIKLSECIESKKSSNIKHIKTIFSEYINDDKHATYDGSEHFFCDSKMMIDQFVRMERIAEDLNLTLKRLKVPSKISKLVLANIPTYKSTGRTNSCLTVSDYYSEETLGIVNTRLHEWFALGGYTLFNTLEELELYFAK